MVTMRTCGSAFFSSSCVAAGTMVLRPPST